MWPRAYALLPRSISWHFKFPGRRWSSQRRQQNTSSPALDGLFVSFSVFHKHALLPGFPGARHLNNARLAAVQTEHMSLSCKPPMWLLGALPTSSQPWSKDIAKLAYEASSAKEIIFLTMARASISSTIVFFFFNWSGVLMTSTDWDACHGLTHRSISRRSKR